ncbi:MAG: CsiV family protein [Pseudomonadales bacterium]
MNRTRPYRWQPAGATLTVALAFMLAGWPLTGNAADGDVSQRWYYTEVVIFQRPQVLEHAGEETLVRERGARLPRGLRLMQGTGVRPPPLDPMTRLCLNFPVLTLAPAPAPFDAIGTEAPAIAPRLEPDPVLDALRRLRAFEDELTASSYRWLPADTLTLGAHAARRARRGGYQVLLHGRWLQPVPPREAPVAMLVQTGPRYGDAYALEGSIGVTLGRFLHFRAELAYREPLMGRAPIDQALAPATDGSDAARAEPLRALTPGELVPDGYLLLQESRRMRSGELHYLDHPKLGILVRIEPVAVPPDLAAALSAAGEQRP